MAALDEDDLVDYANSEGEEDFNEDSLNDEEYNKLYDSLPILKQSIGTYNDTIDDLSLKEALYYNYYDITESVEELKSKFPKKKGMYTFT